MSEITDYLQQYSPDKVAAMLTAWPDWWVFNMMWKSPKDLAYVCERMGFQTIGEVQTWVRNSLAGNVGNAAVFRELVTSPCSVKAADLATIEWPALDAARAEQVKVSADYWRTNSDLGYLLPTRAQLETIARECVSWRYQYSTENNDCDDFTNIARGWLSSVGLGNLAAGRAATVHYDSNGEVLGGHASLLCFSYDPAASTDKPVLTAWFWEPQNGRLYSPGYIFLGGFFAARYELANAEF